MNSTPFHTLFDLHKQINLWDQITFSPLHCTFLFFITNFPSPFQTAHIDALPLAHLSQQPSMHWQLAGSLPP